MSNKKEIHVKGYIRTNPFGTIVRVKPYKRRKPYNKPHTKRKKR